MSPRPKNLRPILLGLALGALLAAGALALTWPDEPSHAPRPTLEFEDPSMAEGSGHDMGEDERCAHMPEHCPPPEARG